LDDCSPYRCRCRHSRGLPRRPTGGG
jgi:hypothetical protein